MPYYCSQGRYTLPVKKMACLQPVLTSNVDCLPGLVSEKAPGMEKCPSTSCWSGCRSEPHQDLWAAPAGHVGTQGSLLGITVCEQQPLEVKGKKQRGQEEQWEKKRNSCEEPSTLFFQRKLKKIKIKVTGEAFQKILRSEILRSEICFTTHDLFLERQCHFQN